MSVTPGFASCNARPRRRRLLLLAAGAWACAHASGDDALVPPARTLTADLASTWAAPRGAVVVDARATADSDALVILADGRILRVSLATPSPASPTLVATLPARPVSAATTCSDGTVVAVGGTPRMMVRLAAGASTPAVTAFPEGLADVHALSCETADDVLAIVDPVPVSVQRPTLLRTNTIAVRLHGTAVDTAGVLPGHEFLLHGGSRGWSLPPFAADAYAAPGTNLVFVGLPDRPAIDVVQTNGRAIGSISYVAEVPPVPRAAVDSALRARLTHLMERLPEGSYAEMLDSLALDRRQPLWTALAADADDNLWVGTNEAVDPGARLWRVYAPDGTPLARLQLPKDLTVLQVTGTRLLGAWHGSAGAEEVRRYVLRPSAREPRGG